MLPIIICDDQKEYRNYLKKLIEGYILIEELDMKVALSVDRPDAVLQYIAQAVPPYLYFLDIDLKGNTCSGIHLAQEIRKFDPRGFIVFITAHGEFSYMTFQYRVEAMDYILKDQPDAVPDRIRQCLFHARDLFSSANNDLHKVISLPEGEKVLLIRQDDVLCLHASHIAHKIEIITCEGIYEQAASLKDMMLLLDDKFFCCHKSWIINTAHIRQLDKKRRVAILENSTECPVSFRKMGPLLELLSGKIIAKNPKCPVPYSSVKR